MKKKALKKDFLMEVKNSLNRYVSILLIVALGVAFFSGVRASESDMQITADRYFDDTDFMDIRVVSTMGLTDNDRLAISEINGVSKVEPVKTLDVLSTTSKAEYIFKLFSTTETINKIKIIEGRLPEKNNECLVDSLYVSESSGKIGDIITFRSGNDTNIEESLKVTKYTIVGIGDSPNYLSYKRGNSSIGNGDVDFFAVIAPETFLSEIYSEIYVTVENTKSLNSYLEVYEDRVEVVRNRIENIAGIQTELRYQEVLKDPLKELETAKNELEEAKEKADKEFQKAEDELKLAEQEIVSGEEAMKEGWEKISEGSAEIEENNNKLLNYSKELEQGKKEIEKVKIDISIWEEALIAKRRDYQESNKTFKEGLAEWQKSYEAYETGLTSGLLELTTEQANLVALGKQLDTAKLKLDEQQVVLTAADQTLIAEEKKLKTSKAQIVTKEAELNKGQEELVLNKEKLNRSLEELKKNEENLKVKEAELEAGKKDLEDGKKSFESEKEQAKNELAEAEEAIKKGEKELSEVEMPKWYVLDRNSVQTYVEYGQDAKRIGNIGKVFPVIFFLVAALVSLTTMTRMVEEQRTQIGTLKALGYSKRSIAGKYMLYALSASLFGSLIGVLIGEQVLPKVIIIAYKIMYYTLPKPITPYNYYYGILSTVVAILCTTLAAFFASYKELAARPAKLMRPVAPKSGKRVILEYLPFIWGKLNFTSKAAVRNLLRYKKRFFMTVFGIGSCTALLIVGFGIKDSISAISDIQYVDLWKQDMIVSLNEDANIEEKTSFLEELRLDEKISGAILVNESTMDAGMGKTVKSVNLVTPKDKKEISDYLVLRDRKSGDTYELQDNGVIITEKLAVLLKVDIGDAIYLEDGDKNRVEVEITAVVENYMMHYIFISSHLYEELYGNIPNYNSVYLKCNISEALGTSFAKDLLEKPIVTNVSFTSEFQKQISDMLNSLNLVVYVLIISAGLLAFIVMYNLNNININERKRELATLKVLGFMDLEVGTYVYRENTMLTIIGSVFGILLGIFLHYFVIVTAELDSMMFGRNIKMISFIYSVLLTFVFSIFVNFVMYFKLQKINMVESLKSVE